MKYWLQFWRSVFNLHDERVHSAGCPNILVLFQTSWGLPVFCQSVKQHTFNRGIIDFIFISFQWHQWYWGVVTYWESWHGMTAVGRKHQVPLPAVDLWHVGDCHQHDYCSDRPRLRPGAATGLQSTTSGSFNVKTHHRPHVHKTCMCCYSRYTNIISIRK